MIAFVFCYFRYGGRNSGCFFLFQLFDKCVFFTAGFFGLVVVFGYLVHLYSMVWF